MPFSLVSSRGANDLPQELLSYIISFLRWDPPSLKACSLVCKSWSGESSMRLFGAVFSPREAADLRDVVNMVQASDRIQGYVKSLWIGPHCYEKPEECMTVRLEDLFDLMASLPNLKELVVNFANVTLAGDPSASEAPDLGHRFNLDNVQVLDVLPLLDCQSREFFAFWTAFSSGVRTVALHDCSEVTPPWTIRDVAVEDLRQLPGPIPIQSLYIGIPATHFRAWVPRLFNLERLLQFELMIRGHHQREMLPFLRDVLHTGKDLWNVSIFIEFTCISAMREIDMQSHKHITSSMLLPDYREHHNLRCFTLAGLTPFPEISYTPRPAGEGLVSRLTEREQSTWGAVADMLGTLTATRVLFICVMGPRYNDIQQGTLRDYLWDQLGRKLDRLPNLRHIFLLVDDDSTTFVDRNKWLDDSETMKDIRDAFPTRLQTMLNFGTFVASCEPDDQEVVYTPPGTTEIITILKNRLHALAYDA